MKAPSLRLKRRRLFSSVQKSASVTVRVYDADGMGHLHVETITVLRNYMQVFLAICHTQTVLPVCIPNNKASDGSKQLTNLTALLASYWNTVKLDVMSFPKLSLKLNEAQYESFFFLFLLVIKVNIIATYRPSMSIFKNIAFSY